MRLNKPRNATEARFIGTGNAWIGQARGWKIQCSRCADHKLIKNMPPNVIIKKMKQLGWQVGSKSAGDICPKCAKALEKAEREARLGKTKDLAARTLQMAVAPMVDVNGHRVHFDEVLSTAKNLEPEQAKELIKVLRDQLPQKQPPKPKPPKPLPESDAEYKRWLDEQ